MQGPRRAAFWGLGARSRGSTRGKFEADALGVAFE
jgi:hypothetical protein